MRNVNGQVLLPINAVRQRYNGVAVTTVERWVADAKIAMPRPRYIGRSRFWRLDELVAWEASRPDVSPKKATAERGTLGDGGAANPKKLPPGGPVTSRETASHSEGHHQPSDLPATATAASTTAA